MAEFKYQTREELVNAVKSRNPQRTAGKSDTQIYNEFIKEFPEFQQKVAENFNEPDTISKNPSDIINNNIEEKEPNQLDKATAMTAISNVVSKDFYKYLPFIRDAELFESANMLKRARRVQDGTASEEDILKIKEFTLEQNQEKSFGYNVAKLVTEIPAYAAEFAAFTGGSALVGAKAGTVVPGVGNVVGGVVGGIGGAIASLGRIAGKRAAKVAMFKAVQKQVGKAVEKLAIDKAAGKVKQSAKAIAETKAAKNAAHILGYVPKRLKAADARMRAGEFAKDLALVKTNFTGPANRGAIRKLLKEQGTGKTLKNVGKSVFRGSEEALVMNLWRSPQAFNQALQRMSPTFTVEDGVLDEEMVLRLVDEGDDFVSALTKAYADQGIEFFSERVGDSLFLLNKLVGGEIVSGATKKALTKAVPKGVNNWYHDLPLKIAVTKHLDKAKNNVLLKESLRRMGWNGTLAEMYEERVGQALRASIGLQDNWLPTPEQLLTEAVAFTIFGAGAGAVQTGFKSKVLGGAGYEAAQRAEDFLDTPQGEKGVLVQNEQTKELDEYVDEVVEDSVNNVVDESPLAKAIRGFGIKGWKPFENVEIRGSVSQLIKSLNADSLQMRLRKMNAEGKSREELTAEAKSFLIETIKARGVTVRNSEVARRRLQEAIKNGEAVFSRDRRTGRSMYVIDIGAVKKRYDEAGRSQEFFKNFQEESKQDRSILSLTFEEYNKFNEDGLLTGEDITDLLDQKGTPPVSELLRLFNMRRADEAVAAWEMLKTARKSFTKQAKEKGNAKDGIRFKFTPTVRVSMTEAQLSEAGYSLPENMKTTDGKGTYEVYVGGRNILNAQTGNAEISISPVGNASTVMEEVIEAAVRLEMVEDLNGETAGYQSENIKFLSNLLKSVAAEAGIDVSEDGYSEIEIISKAFLGGVVGAYTGHQSEAWNSIRVTEEQKVNLIAIMRDLVGDALVDSMIELGNQNRETTKPKEETAKETTEETKPVEETTEETTEETDKPKKIKTKLSEEIKKVDTSLPKEEQVEAITKAIETVKADVSDAKAQEIDKVARTIQEAIDKSPTDSIVKNVLEIINNQPQSFSLEIIPTEETVIDIVNQLEKELHDYDHDKRLLSEINNSRLSQIINEIYIGKSEAPNYYYYIMKENPETKKIIEDIVSSYDAFVNFLNIDSKDVIEPLKVLHDALLEFVTSTIGSTNKDAYDMLTHIHQRYENSQRLVMIEINKFGSKILNKSWSTENIERNIKNHLQSTFGITTGEGKLKALIDGFIRMRKPDGTTDHAAIISALHSLTGIPTANFDSIPIKDIDAIYEDIISVLAYSAGSGNTLQNVLTYFTSQNKEIGNTGFERTFVQRILYTQGLEAPLKITFKNTDGNTELAMRLNSQIIEAALSIAGEQGIPALEALAMISGIQLDNGKKVGHKRFDRIDREQSLLQLFKQDGDFYYQSAGAMGGKSNVYGILMKKIYEKDFKDALAKYTEIYNNAVKTSGNEKHVKQFLMEPSKVSALMEKASNEKDLFKINYIINNAIIGEKLHGNYSSYKNITDFKKRAHQIPTPGIPLKNINNINYILIDDLDNELDGQGVYTDDFGMRAAAELGPLFMYGSGNAESIKPIVRYTKDGVVYMFKGSLINAANLEGGIHQDLNTLLNKINSTGKKVDMIIPKSAAKLGFFGTALQQKAAELSVDNVNSIDPKSITIGTMQGKDFKVVQNLNYNTDFRNSPLAKQLVTDMHMGLNQDTINKIQSENTQILLSLLNDNFDLAFGREAEAIRKELLDNPKADLKDLTPLAQDRIDAIAKAVTFEATLPYETARELLTVVAEVLKDHAWNEEANADYFRRLQIALESDAVLETDPQVSKFVEQMKARFIQRSIQRTAPRVMMQKVSSYGYNIPTYSVQKDGVRLAWIISNTKGVREATDRDENENLFTSIDDAINHIQRNKEKYIDMFVVDPQTGEATNQIKTWEIYDVQKDLLPMDINEFSGKFVIPGGIILESRIPAENLQSHAAHRLWKKVNKDAKGNYSITSKDISKNKGEDFDGDIGYQHYLDDKANTTIKKNKNKILLLMAATYEDPKIIEAIQKLEANPEVFDEIASKRKNKVTTADLFVNELDFELETHDANRASLQALGIVASNNKFFSLLEYMGYELKTTYNQFGEIVIRKGKKLPIKERNNIEAIIKKSGWATDLLNIAVDNASAQQMAPLGLNENNIAIAQLLLFLSQANTKEQIKAEMNKIVDFLWSAPMQDYVEAIKKYNRNSTQERFDLGGRNNFIKKYMQEKGHDLNTQILPIMQLDAMASDVSNGNKLINSEFTPPSSIGELIQREELLQEFTNKKNKYFVIDTNNNAFDQIKSSLSEMRSKVYNNNILSGQFGKMIINPDNLPDYARKNIFRDKYINNVEQYILQKIAEYTVNGNQPFDATSRVALYNIIQNQIRDLINSGEYSSNKFLQLIDISIEGRIQVDPKYQSNQDFLLNAVESIMKDFDKLPAALQANLVTYQIAVYGLTDSTWNGGYLMFIGKKRRLALSQAINKNIQEFINFENKDLPIAQIAGEARKFMEEASYTDIENTTKPLHKQSHVDIFENNQEESDILLKESLDRKVLKIDSIADKELSNDLSKYDSMVDDYINDKEHNKDVIPIDKPEQGMNHSLLSYHQAITYAAPITMAGATGALKQNFDLKNDADTVRLLGRLVREQLEHSVGARRKLGRKAEKIDESDIALGKRVLAAIGAKLTGTEEVVLDVVEKEIALSKAIDIVFNQEKKKVDTEVWNGKPPASLIKKARKAINQGLATEVPMKTYGQVKRVLIEAEMNEYLETTGRKDNLIPVKYPVVTSKTASEIYREYNANKKDWMATAEQVEQTIRDNFEKQRLKLNKEKGAYIAHLGKVKNYLPMMFAQHPYLTKVYENRKEQDPETDTAKKYRGDVRSISRTGDINTFQDMVDNGYMPLTTNPAELFEIYTRQTSQDRYIRAAYQMMMMQELPDGTPLLIPAIDIQQDPDNKFFNQQFINEYASKLQFAYGNIVKRKPSEGAISYINKVIEEVSTGTEYVLKETGIPEVPTVYVLRGHSANVMDMIIGKRYENKWLSKWEALVAWTKFAAIGFPYLSWFHHLALLESQVAIGGIKGSSVWQPRQHWKAFEKFSKDLKDDPFIAEKWYKAGMRATLEDPDYAQGLVNQHIEEIADYLQKNLGGSSAKALRKFLDLKKNWDYKLWVQLHAPLKLWTAEGLLLDARNQWAENNVRREADGLPPLPFEEAQVINEIAELVDSLYGGVNFQRRIWATPHALQIANNVSFAFDWTYSAASMAGAGAIPGLNEVFGTPTDLQQEIRLKKYIPAFYAIVMFGIPNAIQAAIYGITRPVGEDDDEPLIFLNEEGRATWIDVTPLYRVMPFYDNKQYGTDSGERRVYLRWGKQGYEIGGWLTNPIRTAGYKLSVPLKQAIEQLTGRSMGGWDLAYKNADYYGVFEAAGSFWNSRVGNIAKMYVPFSVQDIINGRPTPLPAIPVNFAKMKQGKHQWYAAKELAELYIGYTKQGNFEKLQDHKQNLYRIGAGIVAAAVKNGANADAVMKQGLANARAELYKELENAMKKKKYDKANGIAVRLRALEASAFTIKKIVKENL